MGHGIQKRKRQLTPMYVFDIPSDWPQPLPIDQEIVMSLSNLDNGLKATVEPDPDNHPRSFGRVTITRVKNRNKFKVLRIERGDAIHAEVQAYMERIALQHLKATGRGITDAVSVGDTSPF